MCIVKAKMCEEKVRGAQQRASCGCILDCVGAVAGLTLRGAARSRTLQEGPKVCCRLALTPGEPQVPHCEERRGAAPSRRDQMCVKKGGDDPRKTAFPTLRGAARSRTLQKGPMMRCGLAAIIHDTIKLLSNVDAFELFKASRARRCW